MVPARLHAERRTDHRHDERSGHPLAGDVRNDDAERVVVHADEVVVIAADFLRGPVEARDVVAADRGHALRQQGLLDLLRDLHLLVEPLLLDDVLLRFAELRGDLVEGAGDLADLLRPRDLDIVAEGALADGPDAVGERLDRPHEYGDEQIDKRNAGREHADEEQRHHGSRIDDVLHDELLGYADDDPPDRRRLPPLGIGQVDGLMELADPAEGVVRHRPVRGAAIEGANLGRDRVGRQELVLPVRGEDAPVRVHDTDVFHLGVPPYLPRNRVRAELETAHVVGILRERADARARDNLGDALALEPCVGDAVLKLLRLPVEENHPEEHDEAEETERGAQREFEPKRRCPSRPHERIEEGRVPGHGRGALHHVEAVPRRRRGVAEVVHEAVHQVDPETALLADLDVVVEIGFLHLRPIEGLSPVEDADFDLPPLGLDVDPDVSALFLVCVLDDVRARFVDGELRVVRLALREPRAIAYPGDEIPDVAQVVLVGGHLEMKGLPTPYEIAALHRAPPAAPLLWSRFEASSIFLSTLSLSGSISRIRCHRSMAFR